MRTFVERLAEEAPLATSGRPVVLVDERGYNLGDLARGLRRRGIDAKVLEGGFAAWQRDVLADDARWPIQTIAVASAATDESSPAAALPEVDLAAIHRDLRQWLAGRAEGLPPRLALPGSIPPQTKAVTVRARGGAGGGCG